MRFLLTLLLVTVFSITSLLSQTTLAVGFVDSTNNLVETSQIEIENMFEFHLIEEDSIIICIIKNLEGEIVDDVIVWNIESVTNRDKMHTYHVIDSDGDFCYLSFMMKRKEVFILDVLKSQYSAMSGKNLSYTNL